MDGYADQYTDGEANMAENSSSMEDRVNAVETAQAPQAATQVGAQATQSAGMAGLTSTVSAMQAGTMATVAAGSVALIVGIFLGMAIARRH